MMDFEPGISSFFGAPAVSFRGVYDEKKTGTVHLFPPGFFLWMALCKWGSLTAPGTQSHLATTPSFLSNEHLYPYQHHPCRHIFAYMDG